MSSGFSAIKRLRALVPLLLGGLFVAVSYYLFPITASAFAQIILAIMLLLCAIIMLAILVVATFKWVRRKLA